MPKSGQLFSPAGTAWKVSRYVHVHGSFSPKTPARFLFSRQDVLNDAEWQQDDPEKLTIQEEPSQKWENQTLSALVQLVQRLPYLETLH